jgi:purine-binding chemotaxis protein CheW
LHGTVRWGLQPGGQMELANTASGHYLIASAASRLCALSLSDVGETLRPPSYQPVAGAPSFVRGLALIRGNTIPLLDLGALLGQVTESPQRVITLRVGQHCNSQQGNSQQGNSQQGNSQQGNSQQGSGQHHAGERTVGLLVQSVVGVRKLPSGLFESAPKLLGQAAEECVALLGSLDAQLLVVLRSSKIVPPEVWATLNTDFDTSSPEHG